MSRRAQGRRGAVRVSCAAHLTRVPIANPRVLAAVAAVVLPPPHPLPGARCGASRSPTTGTRPSPACTRRQRSMTGLSAAQPYAQACTSSGTDRAVSQTVGTETRDAAVGVGQRSCALPVRSTPCLLAQGRPTVGLGLGGRPPARRGRARAQGAQDGRACSAEHVDKWRRCSAGRNARGSGSTVPQQTGAGITRRQQKSVTRG